jgi:hypothetical protein
MKKTETYKLGKIKQLIDLNGDTTNFDLTFNVSSKDGSEFEALVVDQATLDNNPNIEYKKAPGTISGNIVADKNVYQNYFLLLKSENPCECVVSTEIKNIPPNPKFVKESFAQKTNNQNAPPTQNDKSTLSKEKPKFDMKRILLILVLIGLAAFVYFKFFRKSSKGSDGKIENIKDDESVHNSVFTTPVASKPTTPFSRTNEQCTKDICTPSIPTVKTPISVQTPTLLSKKINEGLLDKLKGLPTIKKAT